MNLLTIQEKLNEGFRSSDLVFCYDDNARFQLFWRCNNGSAKNKFREFYCF